MQIRIPQSCFINFQSFRNINKIVIQIGSYLVLWNNSFGDLVSKFRCNISVRIIIINTFNNAPQFMGVFLLLFKAFSKKSALALSTRRFILFLSLPANAEYLKCMFEQIQTFSPRSDVSIYFWVSQGLRVSHSIYCLSGHTIERISEMFSYKMSHWLVPD